MREVVVQHQDDDRGSINKSEIKDDLFAILTVFIAINNGKSSVANRRAHKARELKQRQQSQATEVSQEGGPRRGAAVKEDQEQEVSDSSNGTTEAGTQ